MKKYNTALIIDDDYDLCMLLKAVLDSSISAVYCATNLKLGKKILVEYNPDVIFLDNNLPDGQGIHFIKEIKDIHPECVVIAISAMDNFRDSALTNGANMFLEKPLSAANINLALGILQAR